MPLQLAAQVLLVAEVVDEDDLVQVLRGRVVQHAPDRPQERRPGLVGEDDDDADRGQLLVVLDGLALRVPSVGHGPGQLFSDFKCQNFIANQNTFSAIHPLCG